MIAFVIRKKGITKKPKTFAVALGTKRKYATGNKVAKDGAEGDHIWEAIYALIAMAEHRALEWLSNDDE